MTTNTNPTTCPVRWVWTQTDKHGKVLHFGWLTKARRAVRVSPADFEVWVATEQAQRVDGHPFKAVAR